METSKFYEFLREVENGKMRHLCGVGLSQEQCDIICDVLDRKIEKIKNYKNNNIITRIDSLDNPNQNNNMKTKSEVCKKQYNDEMNVKKLSFADLIAVESHLNQDLEYFEQSKKESNSDNITLLSLQKINEIRLKMDLILKEKTIRINKIN